MRGIVSVTIAWSFKLFFQRFSDRFSEQRLPEPQDLTPPPKRAYGAEARRALPLRAGQNRPDIGGNRCGLQPAIGRASCLLFVECEDGHARGGRLRVRHQCDRTERLTRFLSRLRRGWYG